MRQKTFILSMLCTLLIAGILTACGSTPATDTQTLPTTSTATSQSTPTTTSNQATTTPADGASQPTATTPAAPTQASNNGSSTFDVTVRKIPSHQAVGSTLDVLTTPQGFTLYTHFLRGASGFTCDGACAKIWHPLLFKGTGEPTSAVKLPGKLSVGSDALGNRVVMYQGYVLYTSVKDKAPGDSNGSRADNDPWQPAVPDDPVGL
ncbi:hypothetical protein EPA93_47160 [Ktedonosporobacter rubrisoli]|uniref:Lipoprotein n=1 Tax=Ktedonosporobacter rubrisoli TaxID=2509675 RepID=A0A4P6K5B7_KTERU|nr:hypothetical protein [Ktedonosporobacter rubrisoli]QBD83143.1 hypothetical protein EPA93_47160 [Ktedonosporobacter rubrisoli]